MPSTSKYDMGTKSKKKVKKRQVAIFVVVLGDGIFLTKFRNMAILRLSWRGSANSKKYVVQLLCVKKGPFLPHTSVGNEVFEFLVHFPEDEKLVEIS